MTESLKTMLSSPVHPDNEAYPILLIGQPALKLVRAVQPESAKSAIDVTVEHSVPVKRATESNSNSSVN